MIKNTISKKHLLSVINFKLIVLALALSACSQSDNKKSDPKLRTLSTHNEKITCSSTTVQIEQYENQPSNKTQIEFITESKRRVTILADGTEKYETAGENTTFIYDINSNDEKVFNSKNTENYVAERETTKTTLEDGSIKQISKIKSTKTRTDGKEFSDENGNKSKTRTYEYTTETVSRTSGDTTVDVSYKKDGIEYPVYDYVTKTRIDGKITTERTTLQTSYTEKFNDLTVTTVSDDQICKTEVLN